MDDQIYLDNDQIGPRLRELREAAELSADDLAVGARTTAEAIDALERGERSPVISELIALSEALGVSTDDVLLREPDPAPLFRNSGGEQAAELAQREMDSIMIDLLSLRTVLKS